MKHNLTEKEREFILKELRNTPLGNIVDHLKIKEYLNVDMYTVYDILDEFHKNRTLEYNFHLFCDKCNTFFDIYTSLHSIPKKPTCNKCSKSLDHFENTLILFKKIREHK